MPFANENILDVAKKRKLPFIIVTNDLDTTNYIFNIKQPNYDKFFYTLAFDDAEIKKRVELAEISPEQVVVTGFPLRRSFLRQKI